MKKRIAWFASIILVLSFFIQLPMSVSAEGEYTFSDTEFTLFACVGTPFYNIPDGSGEVIFIYPMNFNISFNGVCNETGWYRTNLNCSPAYINPKDLITCQDAYSKFTIGINKANQKVAKTLHDGTKLFQIGSCANGMPVYSIYCDITAPDYFLQAINDIGITPEDSDFTKIDKVRNYVSSHVTYDMAYSAGQGFTTYSTLTNGRAVCAGYANATNALLLAVGVDSYYLCGGNFGGPDSHAWNGVWVDGTMYYFEPQLNSSQSPLTQDKSIGRGYGNASMNRFYILDKIGADQKNLMEAVGVTVVY